MFKLISFNASRNAPLNEPMANRAFEEESREDLWMLFLTVGFVSAVYLCILSVLTVVSNGVLLIALYHDPFKTFRRPPTIFITSLAVADFITGAAVDPVFAYFYFEVYRDSISAESYNTILKAAGILSSLTMNVSFLTVLFLSWTQFVAITFPHRHKQLVTVKRAVACICGIWSYSLLFSFSLLMGVPERTFQKIDVFLNLSLIYFLVLLAYAALHISYRRRIAWLAPFRSNAFYVAEASKDRRKKIDKQFVVVSLLLTTCLLVFIAPVTAMWYLTLYWKPVTYETEIKATIANIITDAMLFLKFLIDPFIYAWRLPKFRQAVKVVFTQRRASIITSIVGFNLPSTSPGRRGSDGQK